ncbi:MAG: hypothetical protein A2Y65_00890 [Deltaproteobacteria bacterium RBG_13_52_11]|nr:MAG: hypothetical protein A2Y65_00890 [Deltaproteobacteria bacterium RBG_13_52_11]
MISKDPYVAGRCSELDILISDALSWADDDSKLAAHLAAYISVLIVGVFEDCIEHLIGSRAKKTEDHEIHNYIVRVTSQRFRNPSYAKIAEMLKDFSQAYQQTFKSTIAPNGNEADALQSLVDNKNALAHAGTAKLNLTLDDVSIYYRQSLPILQTLEQILT